MPANDHEAGGGARGAGRRGATGDPRRVRNIRTGLLLAAVAASFFALILLKLGWYGR